MKILFLCSRFPYPPNRGDRLTIFTLLKLWAPRHQVTLASFVDGTEAPEAIEEVSRYARVQTVHLGRVRSWIQAWLGLFSPVPSQVAYYRSGAMHALVKRLLASEPYDLVFTHTFRMAPYAMRVDHPVKVMWIGDSAGVMYRGSAAVAPWWKRIGILWESHRVENYEVLTSRAHSENWALSDLDQKDLTRIGCHNVLLVPHGVDERLFDVRPEPAAEPRVVYLGNLSVPTNIDSATYAAREVWPLVRPQMPNARLCLVGADPVPAVLRLDAEEGVEVVGPVPDLRDVWKSASAILVPLRFGAGIQNKMLEAMAAGVPVVSTPRAAEAIGVRHGEHLLVAESTEDLAAALVETLRDPAAAVERAERARRHIRDHFTWNVIMERIERAPMDARSNGRSAPREAGAHLPT